MKTSKLHHIPIQAMNAIFDAIMQDTNLIFWMRTSDYARQLYVSDCFKDIWGIPTETLYEHPSCYGNFVLPDDKTNYQKRIQRRLVKPDDVEDSVNEYRIINNNNEIRWVRDLYFPIFDNDGNRVAVAGICEASTNSHMSEQGYINNYDFYLKRRNQLQNDIDVALERELKLRREVPTTNDNIITANQLYVVNKQNVRLSCRQAQCINGLLAGKSSKIIAHELELAICTVDEYIKNIRDKIDSPNRVHLTSLFSQAKKISS